MFERRHYMITVKELKNGNESYFEIEIKTDNKTTVNKVYYRAIQKEKDGVTYMMLYNTNMVPVSNVFEFLNFTKSNQSINSKIKSLQALKLLFSFQDIINKKIEDFTPSDVTSLKHFLKGYSPKGQVLSFEMISSRSNETVNGYLSVYRQYLEFLGKNNEAITARSEKSALIILPDSEADYKVDKFKSNEKVAKKPVEVPKYISVEEFQNIIKDIRANYTKREEIIVRLMYQCGLRIGECLGITADDLVMEKIEDAYYPILYIRNRLSDKPYQNAKTCMKITNKKQYRSKEYKTAGYGYQKVVLPIDLYDLINEYIEEEHSIAREKKEDNYYHSTIADRVGTVDSDDDNYYVFINSLGRPISGISWNNIIRDIFNDCGILVDKGVKENNLNHRFRHGFAMFNVQYLNCKEIELKERMRHNSLQSVAFYFQPTTSDSIKLKSDFTKNLYDIIPELKGD